jgi:hypothetical protein
MFGVIIQHTGASASDLAQTLVVPFAGSSLIFTRDGVGKRGSAGAWRREHSFATNVNGTERVLGNPVAVQLTELDERALERHWDTQFSDSPALPSVLFQKADRKVRDFSQVTNVLLEDVVADIAKSLDSDPSGAELANYNNKRRLVSAPAPAPSVVVSAPAPAQAPQPAPVSATNSAGSRVQWASLSTPSITDPEVANYRVRENLLGGSVSEVKVFDECRADQRHVSIVGHAGTGKTSSVRHYSALRGLPLVTLECDIALDETQTEGTYIPTGNGNELVWAYSALATAVQQPSVILLNELSRLAPKNASLFLSLLAERKLNIGQRQGEVIQVHPECLIVADMNPLGYSGVSKQDQALLDRFRFNVTYEYDLNIDRLWCKSETFLREVVQRWRDSQQADPSATPFSHRLTEAFSWTASKFGLKPAVLQLLERFQPAEREALKLSLTSSSIEIASELGIDHDNIHTSL